MSAVVSFSRGTFASYWTFSKESSPQCVPTILSKPCASKAENTAVKTDRQSWECPTLSPTGRHYWVSLLRTRCDSVRARVGWSQHVLLCSRVLSFLNKPCQWSKHSTLALKLSTGCACAHSLFQQSVFLSKPKQMLNTYRHFLDVSIAFLDLGTWFMQNL